MTTFTSNKLPSLKETLLRGAMSNLWPFVMDRHRDALTEKAWGDAASGISRAKQTKRLDVFSIKWAKILINHMTSKNNTV